MSTVNNKLTNLADEIRELFGTTEPLGLDEMKMNVKDANTEVTSQTDLIAQLASALRGKSVPGDEESSSSIETCTVKVTIDNAMWLKSIVATVFSNDDIDSVYIMHMNSTSNGETIENVVCGSFIHIQVYNQPFEFGSTVSGAEYIRHFEREACFKITANANETATITIYDNN